MKIILSPSKTQDHSEKSEPAMTAPVHEDKAVELMTMLGQLSGDEIMSMMNIKGNLMEETLTNIKNFTQAKANPAITTYTGLVFKYFDLSAYGPDEMTYLKGHLNILSALYGILRPTDGIRPYRLDMKMKPKGMNLYTYWKETMDQAFLHEEVIIDLASNEFSKMVRGNKITVGFRDYKDGKYKNLATYSKMARGMLLHEMVLNKTDSVDELTKLSFGGYSYNPELSKKNLILFTRLSPMV